MDGIRLEVNGNIAKVIERPARITAGTVGLPVEFSFDSQWNGLSKTAVFRAGFVTKIVENLEEETTVPWEVLALPKAHLAIGVYGVNKEGSIAIPTIWCNVCAISAGANPDGDPSTDPSLPVWQKLWDAIGDLSQLETEDGNNLVAAINEANNIALAGGIETDPTLSINGKAAEAEATGKRIEDASSALNMHIEYVATMLRGELASKTDVTATAGNYLVGSGTSNVSEHTPAQVLANIGAEPIKQFNGKTVHKEFINFGALPASGQLEFKVASSGATIDNIVTLDIIAYDTVNTQYAYKFPHLDTAGSFWGTVRKTGARTFNIYAVKDMSQFTATVYVEYTLK